MCQSFEKNLPNVTANLIVSFGPKPQPSILDNQSYFTQKTPHSKFLKKFNEKDLSVRSISTNKKPHLFKLLQKSTNETEHQQTDISERAKSNYEEIERILKNQNSNLKEQNEYLLREISKLKAINKKCKQNYLEQQCELEGLRQECAAQKNRADQMKNIIMTKLKTLENKALGQQVRSPAGSAIGILQGLSLTESGVEHSVENSY